MIRTLLLKLRVKGKYFIQPSLSLIKKEFIHVISSTPLFWQILFFYFPVALLFSTSFLTTSNTGRLSLSFQHFSSILNLSHCKAIASSLSLAFSTAVIALCIAFPLSYFIVFKTNRWKHLLLFFLLIPFWTNFLLHIYAWFFILDTDGLINTILLHIGFIKTPFHFLNTEACSLFLMVYYYTPFIALPLFSALERFDTSFFEASLTLGASRVKTFTRIVLPIIQKSIISGFFLVFIPAFGEFIIPELIGGDKVAYVGSVISIHLLGENETNGAEGLAFATLSIAVLLLCSYIIYLCLTSMFNVMQGDSHDKS